jgi:hypothetical protein
MPTMTQAQARELRPEPRVTRGACAGLEPGTVVSLPADEAPVAIARFQADGGGVVPISRTPAGAWTAREHRTSGRGLAGGELRFEESAQFVLQPALRETPGDWIRQVVASLRDGADLVHLPALFVIDPGTQYSPEIEEAYALGFNAGMLGQDPEAQAQAEYDQARDEFLQTPDGAGLTAEQIDHIVENWKGPDPTFWDVAIEAHRQNASNERPEEALDRAISEAWEASGGER